MSDQDLTQNFEKIKNRDDSKFKTKIEARLWTGLVTQDTIWTSHLIGTENDQNWYDVLRNDQIITSDHIFAKNIKRGYSLTLLHHRIRNTLHQYDNWKRFFSLKFSILIFPGDFRLHGLFKTSLI